MKRHYLKLLPEAPPKNIGATIAVMLGLLSIPVHGISKALPNAYAAQVQNGANETAAPSFLMLAGSYSGAELFTKLVGQTNAYCTTLPQEYFADCISQNLRAALKGINIRSANDKLTARGLFYTAKKANEQFVRYRKQGAPTLQGSGKTYRAIEQNAIRKAYVEIQRIVTEVSTRLLTSG